MNCEERYADSSINHTSRCCFCYTHTQAKQVYACSPLTHFSLRNEPVHHSFPTFVKALLQNACSHSKLYIAANTASLLCKSSAQQSAAGRTTAHYMHTLLLPPNFPLSSTRRSLKMEHSRSYNKPCLLQHSMVAAPARTSNHHTHYHCRVVL
jgi:hypothetical protein